MKEDEVEEGPVLTRARRARSSAWSGSRAKKGRWKWKKEVAWEGRSRERRSRKQWTKRGNSRGRSSSAHGSSEARLTQSRSFRKLDVYDAGDTRVSGSKNQMACEASGPAEKGEPDDDDEDDDEEDDEDEEDEDDEDEDDDEEGENGVDEEGVDEEE